MTPAPWGRAGSAPPPALGTVHTPSLRAVTRREVGVASPGRRTPASWRGERSSPASSSPPTRWRNRSAVRRPAFRTFPRTPLSSRKFLCVCFVLLLLPLHCEPIFWPGFWSLLPSHLWGYTKVFIWNFENRLSLIPEPVTGCARCVTH